MRAEPELHFEEMGAGRPLVLLHGFGGSSKNWAAFATELATRFRLILVDLRGHGRSTNPGNTFTHREAAEDVWRLVDSLGLERFSAMGMSTGGMVLMHMATQRPERIDAMVLISATTHFPDQARMIMKRAALQTMPPDVQAMYRACASRGEPQIQQLISQFNALASNDEDMRFDAKAMSSISARTLIVHGDRDRFFPVEIPVSMYRAIPRSELWIVPGGEHVPLEGIPFVETAIRFLG